MCIRLCVCVCMFVHVCVCVRACACARACGVQFHVYADDTQLFATFYVNDKTSLTSSLQTLECCIAEIRS